MNTSTSSALLKRRDMVVFDGLEDGVMVLRAQRGRRTIRRKVGSILRSPNL